MPTSSVQAPDHDRIAVILAGMRSSSRRVSVWARSLYKDPGLAVIDCTEQPREILFYCQKLAPCILVIDESVFRRHASSEFRESAAFNSMVRVLAIADAGDRALAEQLLRMGCAGALDQNAPAAAVKKAIHKIASGELWFPRMLLSQLIRETVSAASGPQLTARELEILQLIRQGYKNRQIADELGISRETVRWHIRSLYSKLGMHSREDITAYPDSHRRIEGIS